MRRVMLLVAVGLAGVGGCDDGSSHRLAPDTALDIVPPALSNQKHVEILFHNLGNANQFFCTIDGAAPAPCISPFVADLADGAHMFTVAAALNSDIDETPAEATWTIDTVAPQTNILSGPPPLDNSPSPQFTFDGSDDRGNVTFECALDGAAFATCSSPFALTGVVDGLHSLAVRAKDGAGNVDATPATLGWTLDTAAPDTTITNGPSAGSTTAAAVTFEFTSNDAGATFECAVDLATFAACTSPQTLDLASGAHTFAVRAKDVDGLVDPSPASVAWTVDATPPDVTITSTPGDPSNDPTPAFAFTSSDASATFACSVDGGAFGACTSPFTSAALADGSHSFTVRATDPVGNAATASPFAWLIDTVAPTVTITSAPAALSNDPTPTVAFTTAGGATAIDCQIDSGTFAACTSPFTTAALADGSHTITVRAADAAGNAGTTSSSFAIDTVPPTVTITTAPAALSNDSTPTTVFVTGGGATATTCKIDGGAFVACTSPFTTGVLADGTHTITVRAVDGANNAATTATPTFIIDTVPPTVTITSSPSALSNDTTPTVAFTVGGGATTTECAVDGGAFAACTSPFTSGALGDGAHTITVRVTDGAGNSATASTASFTIDTVPPTVTITSQPAALSNDVTPTVAFTTGGGATATSCQIDAGTFAACLSPFTTTALADGAHTITVRATDGAGNSATASTASFTIDTAPPTVTITSQPAALSNDPTPSVAFTTAGGATSTTCQIDAGTFAACTSPFTASALADGTHTITIRATDGAGNSSSATTNSFTIDTAPPTITITSQPAALSNDPTPSVSFTVAGATIIECQVDAGAFASCSSPFTTTTLADGAHAITIRASDAAGNTATATTASFTIDTVPPTVTLTGQPATLSNDSTPTVTFTTAGGATTTDCRVDAGTFAACTSPFTAGALADGAHTISVRATDGAGNSTTATTVSFTIDTVPPTITITGQPAALSNDSTPTVTFTVAGATTINCRVDAGTFAGCASPFTPSVALADGAHTITILASDAAGNTATATTTTFTIDTVPPSVTIVTQPAALSNDATPTVTFTTAGGATATACQIDAGTFTACTSPNTFGPLADGTHTITVRATDGAGNSGTATTASFTIDTVPPTVAITVQPAALSNDSTPSMSFTAGGGATMTECRVDAGAFVACTSPFTASALADGSHAMAVRATDGAGNQTIASTATFTIDTVPPGVVLDDVPPAQWPVDYFDMRFHATETATLTCSLNGGAFAACADGQTFTTVYNVGSTFTVRATDAAGNTGSATTSWTSADGLVLHYPWEQGTTINTSLLAQNAAYSPDGSVAAIPFLGGWAGTAAGSSIPRHTYRQTNRPLLSSAQPGNGTVSFWIRPTQDTAAGTLISTLGTAGLRAQLSSTQLTVDVLEPTTGALVSKTIAVALGQWTNIALVATGPGKGLEIFRNGNFVDVVAAPTGTGFDAGMAQDLTVGASNVVDVDDLRFFNRALANAELCSVLARGFTNPLNAQCVPLSPGYELDFEGGVVTDTGFWNLLLQAPQAVNFVPTTTGNGIQLPSTQDWGYAQGFSAQVNSVPAPVGRSFSLWFDPSQSTAGRVIDFTRQCVVGGPLCGIRLDFLDTGQLSLFVATSTGFSKTTNILIGTKRTSIVVTESRNANQSTIVQLFLNGSLVAQVPITSGNVYQVVRDDPRMPAPAGVVVDELEFWTADLAQDPEMLCENGFDGSFDPATGTCLLTSN
jgi:Big-like domain-containing protein